MVEVTIFGLTKSSGGCLVKYNIDTLVIVRQRLWGVRRRRRSVRHLNRKLNSYWRLSDGLLIFLAHTSTYCILAVVWHHRRRRSITRQKISLTHWQLSGENSPGSGAGFNPGRLTEFRLALFGSNRP